MGDTAEELEFFSDVVWRKAMLGPLIFSAYRGVTWFSILPMIILMTSYDEPWIPKIIIGSIVWVAVGLIYCPFLLFSLWRKFKQENIPESILDEASFFEKERYISDEVSSL